MPSAPAYPCSVCKQVGCTAHRRTAWRGTQPPPQRIRGRKLQLLRRYLYIKEPFCRLCQRPLLLATMIRDHIIPLAEGGPDTVENSQPLCRECSDAKTQQEAARGVQRSRWGA